MTANVHPWMPGIRMKHTPHQDEARIYYTARHLLEALNNLDDALLDMPLVLVHGKELQKPNLVQGFLPAPLPVQRDAVEAKAPSLLALGGLLRGDFQDAPEALEA